MNTNNNPNRLLRESSPYLNQHAYNPVDWYPWGEEVFEKAEAEDKPIFLSIGYSTCHWCHVMAYESFEDDDVAHLLNNNYISIKVDREERPDIDEVYMNVCQAMTGSGGWPLTIFMTPDKRPFFAGTYFPKETAFGRMGVIELLGKISDIWKKDRKSLIKNSERIIAYFNQEQTSAQESVDVQHLVQDGYKSIKQAFDEKYGGFAYQPKFPTPHYLLFLMKYWQAYEQSHALGMVEKTLESMYRGGLFDHVGYGFSRYSTDYKWLVPHFEKMLYDNALLLLAYTDCYATTKHQKHKDIAKKTAEYVLRDMRSPKGAFYSAEDADSEEEEGKFYVWEYDELKRLLDENDMALIESQYGVTKQGNFEGKNILNLINGEVNQESSEVLKKLYDYRKKRIPPFKDTKILASWNGLMIEAMARAGMVFGNNAYIDSALRAADFILREMTDDNDILFSIYKEDQKPLGFLADYANIINGLISVFEATRYTYYLHSATKLATTMIDRFWEEDVQRFYMTEKSGEALFVRPKDEYDGAMPSGNASAITCIGRLYNITGDQHLKEILDHAINTFASIAKAAPSAHIHFLTALLTRMLPHRQVILVANKDDEETINLYNLMLSEYLPFTTVLYYDQSADMDTLCPYLSEYKTSDEFTGYICEDYACKHPTTSREDLLYMVKGQVKK